MKQAIVIGLGIASFLAVPALAEQAYVPMRPVHHHHVYHRLHRALGPAAMDRNATAQVAPLAPSVFPGVAPYPDGQGDEDGLSRHRGDCNKGCIDGPY